MSLLNSQGNLGLIATNTVAQGDTREVGLEQMVEDGLHDHPRDPEQVVASRQRQPGVCGGLGHARATSRRPSREWPTTFLVERISTLLEPAAEWM